MAFDIKLEKENLDRYLTWWNLKYGSGGSCNSNCGCNCISVQGDFELQDKISEIYYRYMNEHITAETLLGKAKQAFWVNLEFCKNFSDYFWMNYHLFECDNQYWPWKTYLREELGIQEKNDKDDREFAFLERTKKYKTWDDYLPKLDLKELGF